MNQKAQQKIKNLKNKDADKRSSLQVDCSAWMIIPADVAVQVNTNTFSDPTWDQTAQCRV